MLIFTKYSFVSYFRHILADVFFDFPFIPIHFSGSYVIYWLTQERRDFFSNQHEPRYYFVQTQICIRTIVTIVTSKFILISKQYVFYMAAICFSSVEYPSLCHYKTADWLINVPLIERPITFRWSDKVQPFFIYIPLLI